MLEHPPFIYKFVIVGLLVDDFRIKCRGDLGYIKKQLQIFPYKILPKSLDSGLPDRQFWPFLRIQKGK